MSRIAFAFGLRCRPKGGCELAGGDIGVQKTISSFEFLK